MMVRLEEFESLTAVIPLNPLVVEPVIMTSPVALIIRSPPPLFVASIPTRSRDETPATEMERLPVPSFIAFTAAAAFVLEPTIEICPVTSMSRSPPPEFIA